MTAVLLLIAISWLCVASSQHPAAVPLVSVGREPDRKVLVSRGGSVDLRPALDFNLESLTQTVECKVTNIVTSGSACGSVVQNVFDCRNYTGPILYQHLGCYNRRELATFMISISPSGYSPGPVPSLQPAQASILSVEVTVGPPDPVLAALSVEAKQANAHLELVVVFPSMTGQYHYEVVSKSSVLPLPMAGSLLGDVNQPLPSGYVHNTPLTYWPFSGVAHPYTDYILVKLYLHNDTLSRAYAVLPFQTAFEEESNRKVVELERDYIIIHQAINTPISKSDFTSFNLSMNLAGHGTTQTSTLVQPLPLVYYNFPVLVSGSFQSLFSTSTNVSYTIFTSHELFDGHVAFHPTDILSSTEPFIYHYKVTNAAGVLIARGEISVLARERNFKQVPQRKNVPLAVLEGGMAAVNNKTLDFYFTPNCGAQVRVLRPPEHGELVYENGTGINGERILLWAMSRTTLVRYKHLGGEELSDVIYWGIKCATGSERSVFMSVLVVPVDDAPPTLAVKSGVQTFEDWGVPLSPSSLRVRDPDSPRHNIHFTVQYLGGTLLRTFHSITELNNTGVLFPLMSYDNLVPLIGSAKLYEVLDFSLEDLEQQRIWYFPFGGLTVDSIELTVTDSINPSPNVATLNVAVSQLPLDQTLIISTPMQYPYLVKNEPLPLIKEGHMFLTSHFLYSQAPPSSADNVRYVVSSPPQHGYLCLLSHSNCAVSLSSFTQQEINHHRIIYHPKNKDLLPDHFRFVLTVRGVGHISAETHTFNWTVEEHAVVSNRHFWLNSGSKKKISAKFFRMFTSRLQSRNITFQVVGQPKYGHLLLGNGTHFHSSRPTSFTLDDLSSKLVWYNHTQHTVPAHCSDSLMFNATSPSKSELGQLPILFRSGKKDLSVTIHPPHVLLGLTHFTFSSQDFTMTSSFCPEFVTFRVDMAPVQGQLTLKDNIHKTERQLMNGSTFTAKDISLNALLYRFSPWDHMPTSNVSDVFIVNASDPVSEWPEEPRITGTGPGHFFVIIVPSPDEEYHLEVNFSSGHPVTWLPDQQSYGYALTSSDIDLLNSTLRPREVVVQVESGLTLGNLARRDTPISVFTAADLQAGGVTYVKNSLVPDSVFKDEVEFGVYAYLPGFYQRAALHRFVLEWALVELERSAMTVSEQQNTLRLSIRRRGATWFESRIIVETISDTASSQENCSSLLETSDLSLQGAGDFCQLRQEVVFPVGVVLKRVTVQLLDDDVAEGEESFFVQLQEEEGLTNAILHGNIRSKVTITDIEDYNSVSMLGQGGHTDGCDLQTDVEEFSGQLTVNLTRTGMLDQEVGVICYTEDHSAIGDADYLARARNAPGSEVHFGVNQSMAECVITIVDDGEIEHREMFYVHLSPAVGTLVHIDPSYSTMCVYINHDNNDYPIVSFNQTEVFVKESKTKKTYANFTLNRMEPNLDTTTEVKYIYSPKDGDTAVENVDFRLFTSECILEGDTTPGGCVSFSPGSVNTGLVVEIFPDDLLEGNETFHLKIEYARNGRRSRNLTRSTLKVTIIDAAQPSYIELTQTSIWLMESPAGENRVEVRRRGSLLNNATVKCVLKGKNATGGTEDADFIVLLEPQLLTFSPGDINKFCIVFINHDTRYEGLESLMLTLELAGDQPGVTLTPNLDRAIIHITDYEDIPIVEFSSTSYEVKEPLSNSTLDSSMLTLEVWRRDGDISRVSTVSYSTIDQSAKSGRDYVTTSGTIVFEEGVTSATIDLRVLANHDEDKDTNFTVQLSLPNTPTSDPTVIGANGTATVVIRNLSPLGVYFPALPELDNVEEDGQQARTAGMYYDLPLMCITACDSASSSSEDTLTECERQGIANDRTIYSWEVSTDGAQQFHPLNSDFTFLSPHSQVLLPLYLQPGLHVRCTAQAVDSVMARGYSRTSEPVRLSMERYGCYEQGSGRELQAKLSSYDSFTAADQDIVLAELTVPAMRNRVPLLSLSTSPVSPQSCSNVHHVVGHSLLTYSLVTTGNSTGQPNFSPLYSHLNVSTCQWQFSAWYPVYTLVHDCGGRRPSAGLLSVTATCTYLEGATVVGHNQTTASLSASTSTALKYLPPPFHILPQSSRNPQQSVPYLFPLSINQGVSNGEAILKVFFYLVTPAGPLLPSNQSVQLLYTNGTSQVWQLQVQSSAEPVVLRFRSCTECEQDYLFHLPVLGPPGNEAGEAPPLLLDVNTAVLHETLYIGDRVNITLELDSEQQLQGAESLRLIEMYLCEQINGEKCANRLSIMSVGGSSNRFDIHVNMNNAESISVDFSTNDIILVDSSSQWLLHIQLGLDLSTLYQATTTFPLTLLSSPTSDTPVASLPVVTKTSTPLYVIIGVLALVVLSLVILGGVIIGLACMNYGKAKFYQKASVLRNGSKELGEKLNSVRRNSYQCSPAMKRTNSTIGFPTQEHRLKKSGEGTAKCSRTQSRGRPTFPKRLQRSQSLPSIFPSPHDLGRSLPSQEPAVVRKINRHGVRVHFKRVNVESSALNLWNSQQLKRNKELANLHIVQDLAIRYKNYGVNEIQPGHPAVRPRAGHSTGPYAKYVVTTLAASAKTPEPGAKPMTKL